MKKLMKILAAIVLLLVAFVLSHPLWIGPVARTAVSVLVPKFLGVPAKLDGFALNAYTGRLELEGFAIDNPPECGTDKFVSFGRVRVGLDPLSLCSDRIVIDEISINDFFASFMTDQGGVYNFSIIGKHAASGKKESAAESAPKSEKPAEEKPAKKFIIDLLQIQNSVVKWKEASFTLPSFRLTALGRSSGGLEFDAMRAEIRHRFFDQLGPVAKGLSTVLDAANGTLGPGVKALKDLSGNVKGLERGVKALEGGTKALGTATSGSVKAVDETAKSGVKILGDGVKVGADALKSVGGEGAKALKSLFK